MDRLRRLRDYWALGFAVLLLLLASAALFAGGALLIITLLATLMGQGDPAYTDWFYVSAFVWLPISVGIVIPSLTRIFRRRLDAVAEQSGPIEVTTYLRS